MTPDEFEKACLKITETLAGDEAHRRLDALVTVLLCQLGYSAGMAVFLTHAVPCHIAKAEGGA